MENVCWHGFYRQGDNKYAMTFENPSYFVNGARISRSRIDPGSMNFTVDIFGNDSAGRFNMQANFKGVSFKAEKHYPSWIISYKGTLTDKTIEGRWFFNGSRADSGDEFKIFIG